MTTTFADEFYGTQAPTATLQRWVDRKRVEYTPEELLQFVQTVEQMLQDGVPDTGIACVLAEAVVEMKRPKSEPKPAPEKMKVCRSCGERKSLSKFYKDRGSHKAVCKKCYNAARYND